MGSCWSKSRNFGYKMVITSGNVMGNTVTITIVNDSVLYTEIW